MHHFLQAFLNKSQGLQEALNFSYENTLMEFHDQVIRNVFAVSFPFCIFFVGIFKLSFEYFIGCYANSTQPVKIHSFFWTSAFGHLGGGFPDQSGTYFRRLFGEP